MEDAGAVPEFGNLRRKVVCVAAGESHCLALTGDGRVYSWGRGTFGRLGTGSEADELFPVPIKFDSDKKSDSKEIKFVGIAAGAYHSVALADDGTVWCCGYNICILDPGDVSVFSFCGTAYFARSVFFFVLLRFILDYCVDGQLGFSGGNSLVPRLLEQFLELGSPGSLTDESGAKRKTPLKVNSVKAGGMMSLAIDNLGGLWMWGNVPESSPEKVGFSLVGCFTPTPVWDFHGHTVVKVACGNEHVVALVSSGETYKGGDLVCYSWGNNAHGQLGLGDTENRLHPEVVENFNHESLWEVYEVACGAFHTALLTHKRRPNDMLQSMCWTFGLGDNGQLGHGITRSISLPEPVKDLPENRFLVCVDCGLFHTSVVSSAGEVWSWGMEKGLGLCPDASFTGTDPGDAISPLLYGSKFWEPVQVACGAAHTLLVSDEGYKLWSWGRGRSGVLGNGKTVDCFAPSSVLWPPLTEDFRELELESANKEKEKKTENKDPEKVTEMEKNLSLVTEEMKLLRSKLSTMERYASILHGSIFGKPLEEGDIPVSLQNSGSFDIAKEWENMLESADRGKLVRLEMFYRNMLAGVKDKQMKKRIQEIIKECLPPPATGN